MKTYKGTMIFEKAGLEAQVEIWHNGILTGLDCHWDGKGEIAHQIIQQGEYKTNRGMIKTSRIFQVEGTGGCIFTFWGKGDLNLD